jgi:hypothetical protein
MSLPIVLNTPKYEVTLPVSKQVVEYRPYLVKEEKTLMLALESQDEKIILKAVQDIIKACTFEKVDVRKLPTAELEFLFLKLRAKSVGEASHVGFKCKSCDAPNDVAINLDEIDIDTSKTVDPKIMITDNVGVIMRYPTTAAVNSIVNNGKTEVENTFAIITSCIEAIFDAEKIYEASNLEKKDIDQFVESLNSNQFMKIQKFLDGIPRLSKEVDFKCEKCGTDNHLTVEGLQSFFG